MTRCSNFDNVHNLLFTYDAATIRSHMISSVYWFYDTLLLCTFLRLIETCTLNINNDRFRWKPKQIAVLHTLSSIEWKVTMSGFEWMNQHQTAMIWILSIHLSRSDRSLGLDTWIFQLNHCQALLWWGMHFKQFIPILFEIISQPRASEF